MSLTSGSKSQLRDHMKIDFACHVIISIWVNGVTDALPTQSWEALSAPSDRVSPCQRNDLDPR